MFAFQNAPDKCWSSDHKCSPAGEQYRLRSAKMKQPWKLEFNSFLLRQGKLWKSLQVDISEPASLVMADILNLSQRRRILICMEGHIQSQNCFVKFEENGPQWNHVFVFARAAELSLPRSGHSSAATFQKPLIRAVSLTCWSGLWQQDLHNVYTRNGIPFTPRWHTVDIAWGHGSIVLMALAIIRTESACICPGFWSPSLALEISCVTFTHLQKVFSKVSSWRGNFLRSQRWALGSHVLATDTVVVRDLSNKDPSVWSAADSFCLSVLVFWPHCFQLWSTANFLSRIVLVVITVVVCHRHRVHTGTPISFPLRYRRWQTALFQWRLGVCDATRLKFCNISLPALQIQINAPRSYFTSPRFQPKSSSLFRIQTGWTKSHERNTSFASCLSLEAGRAPRGEAVGWYDGNQCESGGAFHPFTGHDHQNTASTTSCPLEAIHRVSLCSLCWFHRGSHLRKSRFNFSFRAFNFPKPLCKGRDLLDWKIGVRKEQDFIVQEWDSCSEGKFHSQFRSNFSQSTFNFQKAFDWGKTYQLFLSLLRCCTFSGMNVGHRCDCCTYRLGSTETKHCNCSEFKCLRQFPIISSKQVDSNV